MNTPPSNPKHSNIPPPPPLPLPSQLRHIPLHASVGHTVPQVTDAKELTNKAVNSTWSKKPKAEQPMSSVIQELQRKIASITDLRITPSKIAAAAMIERRNSQSHLKSLIKPVRAKSLGEAKAAANGEEPAAEAATEKQTKTTAKFEYKTTTPTQTNLAAASPTPNADAMADANADAKAAANAVANAVANADAKAAANADAKAAANAVAKAAANAIAKAAANADAKAAAKAVTETEIQSNALGKNEAAETATKAEEQEQAEPTAETKTAEEATAKITEAEEIDAAPNVGDDVALPALRDFSVDMDSPPLVVPSTIAELTLKPTLKRVHSMIKTICWSDIVVTIGKENFYCHKLVLKAYCKFIADMTLLPDQLILPADDCPPLGFKLVYDWMMESGRNEIKFERVNILPLLLAAQYLQIEQLLQQLWYCIDNLEIFNEVSAFVLYQEAQAYPKAEILQKLMLTRVSQCFLAIVATDVWLKCTEQQVADILNQCSIAVNSEVETLLSVLHWLQYKWPERKIAIEHVMKAVRFAQLPLWYLTTMRQHDKTDFFQEVIALPPVRNMIEMAINTILINEYDDEAAQELIVPMTPQAIYQPRRKWIVDPACQHHHRRNCSHFLYPTYELFKVYLAKIAHMETDYCDCLIPLDSAYATVRTCCAQQMPTTRKTQPAGNYQKHNLA